MLRGMARTAVIAGTATATSNAVNRRMAQKNVAAYGDAQQQYYEQTAQQPPAMTVAAGPSSGVLTPQVSDTTAEIQRLADLKAQGILTDEEFAAAKAKVLGL